MNTGAPLSFAQEQMWVVDQIRAGAAEYVTYCAFHLRGEVDAGVLRAVLQEVARRHEVLRTRYEAVDGSAVQVVDAPGEVDFTVLDDAGIDLGEIERSVLCAPFDLRMRPPWRVVLARRGPADAVLLIAAHHIAFDGWSWRLLMRELGILYAAFADGRPSPLPELELQYADFADWQREVWESAEHAEGLDWWRRRLAGLEPLELPTDRRRPAVWDASADALDIIVPADLAASVRAVAAAAEVTPFMAYLAAFKVLLGRCARRTDIAVGVSVSGREQFELEDMIGLFVNTVVLRTDLSGAPTFAEVLARVRDTALDAFDHQDVPFDRVVTALAPEPDLSRNPVFQAGFALLNEEVFDTPALPGVVVEPLPAREIGATFDLSLIMTQRGDGTVAGRLCYPTALFDPATVSRLAEALQHLLAGLAAAPQQPVHAVELLGDADRARFAEWNNTAIPTTESSLPELFTATALSAPDAVAVVAGSAELTYAELADRVDRLARHLRHQGVVVGTPVGVALPRGADLVTAVLAVLATGGVYVPLPSEQPPSRLAAMAADAGVRLSVTDARSRGLLPDSVEAVFVNTAFVNTTVVDAASADQPQRADARPAIGGANAAYISYTSGSTGRPKGVVITHAGIRNRVLWAVDHLGLGPGERVLQRTTTGFDASLWELLAPLVSGATVVMAPPQAHQDPAAMIQAVADHAVSVLQLVPSLLHLLADEPGLGDRCATLRVVCSAGEALPAELCERLLDRLGAGRVRILNTYGPTEYSIDATAWWYQPGEAAGTVPIGRPLPNTEVFVVDEHDRLVPCGSPGELCLAGVGLATGYLGRGDLTAERFTPNPYASERGSRWYRTGDLVRWRDAGVLEFLGRVDRQVKVRGVRVEPGEVEAALLTHPSVASAAVIPRRDRGQTELVGYVVPVVDRVVVAPDSLRDHVAGLLPPAMVPTAIVAVPALPLTANGKLDHAALPAPTAPAAPSIDTRPSDAVPSDAVPTDTEPTDTELAVAGFMAELLGVPHVGADDDFFASGGHSLLAIRLVLKLRRAFDVDLAADQVFHRRTARDLAAALDSALGPAPWDTIRPVRRGSGLPLSFGQQRMWFVDRLEPGGSEYLIPLAVRLRGPWSPEVLRRAMDDVAARHEILRTRYTEDFTQVVDPACPVAFDLADLAGTAGAEDRARRLLDEAASRPFDLRTEHPLRVTVARIAEHDHLLLVLVHHIASDQWSTEILMRELDQTYQALAAGDPAPLRAQPVQYADYSAWQRGPRSTAAVDAQLDYWRAALAGLAAVELPTDRPRPAHRDIDGGRVSFTVPPDVVAAVGAVGRQRDCTPFVTMLAAFEVLLARLTGLADVAVGTPVAGRTQPAVENLLGFFVNHLVMRCDLSGDPAFTGVLDRVREVVLAGVANQDVPFERVVDELRPDRDLSRNPLFQIVFELDHAAAVPPRLCGAAAEPVEAGVTVAKFDLRLTTRLLDSGALRCTLEYAAALFDRSTIERMAAQFTRLLESIAAAPDAPVSALDLLTPAQRHTVLHEWADPAADLLEHVDPPAVHHLGVAAMVEEQVRRAPDATAVIYAGRRLTYAELNARANRLAHHLRDLGVGPETVVGCLMERGADAIVVWLAVLKSGGVYLPIDAGNPAQRVSFLLADTGAPVVLTTTGHAARLQPGPYTTVTVDGSPAWTDDPRADNPAPAAESSGLAYIIYTSGSTGRPKGVMIDHRAYAHHCRVISERYRSGPDDRVLLLSALTFDVAMDQIAVPLVNGSALVVSDPWFWPPEDLLAKVREHGITTMQITPGYYREIMDRDVSALAGITLMNVGADVVTTADARRWTEAGLTGRFLYNYGPTEATVNCVVHTVEPDLAGGRAKAGLPIGVPLAGSPAYVLDAALRPVPVGAPGELYVGGVRLARGYHDRPELTAERFLPDPFSATPGARLYRTGDLARHRADGTVEFLGRLDHQVKIRGFRIELGEIEATLRRHAEVRSVVVVARQSPAGDRRLVAYVVARAGTGPTVADLRAHVGKSLPEYMVPAHWVLLDALPLTSSKKVDRKALPDPSWTSVGGVAREAPSTPAQRAVATAWVNVLGIEDPSIHDDFFDLGGHSLLAARLAGSLRDAFAVDIPLRLLFENTTIAKAATAITDRLRAQIAELSAEEAGDLVAHGRRSSPDRTEFMEVH